MNLSGIEAFLAIVETQSLSKAAAKLFLSQSTVSNRLEVLENELNTKVIKRERGKRFITLTPKGEEFVTIAKRWMSLKKDTNVWINKETPLKLIIGSVDSLNTYVFPDLYKRVLQNENPLEINVSSHWSNTVFKLLEYYEIDIGLVPKLIRTTNLLSKPVFSENLVFISNSLTSTFDDFVHPLDLNVRKEIFLDWGTSFQNWHDSWWDPQEPMEVTVDTAGLIFKLIDIPNSWAIVPEAVANTYKKIQPLKVSEFLEPPPERVCYMVKHRNPLPRNIESLKIFEYLLNEFISGNPILTII
ncbi:MAG: LysR family transcriptional regulator [Desulfitobacteriaceae bacterium]